MVVALQSVPAGGLLGASIPQLRGSRSRVRARPGGIKSVVAVAAKPPPAGGNVASNSDRSVSNKKKVVVTAAPLPPTVKQVKQAKAGTKGSTSKHVDPFVQLGDWSGGWPGGEKGLQLWMQTLELNLSMQPTIYTQYDPDILANAMKKRRWDVTARLIEIASSLGKFATSLLLDKQMGQLDANIPLRARQLRDTFAKLGPTFVKTGQALSARPDLLPAAYLEQLGTLQDRLQSFPTQLAYTLIEEDLGKPVDEIFSELTAQPVAAASLGQVYKGVLRATGETVAVKVQRPGIAETITLDMFLVRQVGAWLDANTDLLTTPLVPLIDEFASRLFGELDYIQEGKNAEKFEELYGYLPRIGVPKIKWAYTSRRVLVMEWIDGVKLTDPAGMRAYGLDVVDFVTVGIECTLRQLLEHGFFHADPHPGNLLATKDGKLVYLDFGMMSAAPQSARYAIIAHVVHLVNRDYEAMARDYYKLDFLAPEVDTAPIVPALRGFFEEVFRQGDDVQTLNFKSIVDGLGDVMLQFPFNVPAYYALILRTLTVLEGLAMYSDPKFKARVDINRSNFMLLASAYPYMARRLLTDPSPELRRSLEELILDSRGSFRWNRLENLMREGRKSSDFDQAQLWLLVHWLVSDSMQGVRRPLSKELAKLIDAVGIHTTRSTMINVLSTLPVPQEVSAAIMQRIPLDPTDDAAYQRANLLSTSVSSGLAPIDMSKYNNPVEAAITLASQLPARISEVQKEVERSLPELQKLVASPGTAELITQVGQGVLSRMAARAIRAVFGGPDDKRTAGTRAETPL
eukprot:jgi/Chlat1/659/Chrsp103S08594